MSKTLYHHGKTFVLQLKKKCQELESLGGPGIKSKVELYLEEERTLQAKVNQITSSAAKGGSSEVSTALKLNCAFSQSKLLISNLPRKF